MPIPTLSWAELIDRALEERVADGMAAASLRVEKSSYKKFVRLLGQKEGDAFDARALDERHAYVDKWVRAGTLSAATAGGDNSRWGRLAKVRLDLLEESAEEDFAGFLKRKLQEYRKPVEEVAAEIGVSLACLEGWVHGRSLPSRNSFESVVRLENLLECGSNLTNRLGPRVSRTSAKREKNPLQLVIRSVMDERQLSVKRFEKAVGSKNLCAYLYTGVLPQSEATVSTWDEALNTQGRLIRAFREARRIKPARVQGDPYALRLRHWPERARRDWEDLLDYKTTNSEGLAREEDAVWGSSSGGAATLFLQYIESLFGWMIRSESKGGMGISLERLTLGEIISFKTFYAFSRWKRDRMGRKVFNESEKVKAGYICALIRSENAYFFQRRQRYISEFGGKLDRRTKLWDNLPTTLRAENPVGYGECFARPMIASNEDEQWVAHIYLERQKYLRFVKQSSFEKGSILTTQTGKWLVRADQIDIANWLTEKWEEVFRSVPPRSTSPVYWALGIRNCLILGFCIIRGFRRGTLSRLDCSMVPRIKETGEFEFAIPPEIFKAGDKGGSKGGVFGPMPGAFAHLQDLVRIYVEEARPLLLANAARKRSYGKPDRASGALCVESVPANEAFFISQIGTRVGGAEINRITKELMDINVHGFRYLHATDGRKKGLSDEVIAQRLCNTPEMVRRMYEKTTAKHHNQSVNVSLGIVFQKKAAAEQE